MSILSVLGAVSGVLGGVAVLLSALTGRSSSKDTGRREDRRLSLDELNDALAAQRERIDDLETRADVAEDKLRLCEERETLVRSQLNHLLVEIAREGPR